MMMKLLLNLNKWFVSTGYFIKHVSTCYFVEITPGHKDAFFQIFFLISYWFSRPCNWIPGFPGPVATLLLNLTLR